MKDGSPVYICDYTEGIMTMNPIIHAVDPSQDGAYGDLYSITPGEHGVALMDFQVATENDYPVLYDEEE